MSEFYTQSNPGWDKRLLASLKAVKMQVAVGFPRAGGVVRGKPGSARKGKMGAADMGAKVYGSTGTGASVLQVAIWNNFGTAKIPARPFMHQTTPGIIKAANKAASDFAAAFKTAGGTAEQRIAALPREIARVMLPAAGLGAQEALRKTIGSGQFVGNAASTVRRKKSSLPLIDTGIMQASATFAVREAR
jgi:hypothetical protein